MNIPPPSSVPQAGPADVVLHQERLSTGTRRSPTERVVLRRRITEQVRQVEVVVRREELEVHRLPLDAEEMDGGRAAPDRSPDPLVILLSEEVPVVQLQTRPYERVTVRVETVREEQRVTETLGREQIEVTTEATGSAPA